MAASKFRFAMIQLAVTANKAANLSRASEFISTAAKQGAQLVALPECCNSPYGNQYFPEYAEQIPGQSTEVFSKAAADNGVYLIAGSIPERLNDKLFNTTTVFAPDGSLIAKHRKVHLFDIDVPGKITFQESKTLSPGRDFTVVDTPFCKVGLGICYDMRFAEMAQIYSRQGCQLLVYPGAFNMTTGPAHWELLVRARAVDNQCYVAAVSPARDTTSSYVAWGHSSIANPWGDLVAKASDSEEIVYADVDTSYLTEVRSMIPITVQRRHDLYDVVSKADLKGAAI